jgi:hypothetical protein
MRAEPGVSPNLLKRVRGVVAQRRAVRDELALPQAESLSPEQATMESRINAIRLSLERAVAAESVASWEQCVREAASALSDAIEVLARVNDLALLRDLHVEIGVCLTLSGDAGSARPHFVAASLLDETAPKAGSHREEAERVQAEARDQVLAQSKGPVRIETAPPGAELWVDGQKATGTTPLYADVRLGNHFITVHRFRYEPHTELALLQPSGVVRIALDPAQRSTLREQLSSLATGSVPRPSEEELRLAETVWSRAEQLVVITHPSGQSSEVKLVDALTGDVLRQTRVNDGDDDDAIQRRVCETLGETCAPSRRGGVPWYVWPVSGVAVAGAIISATFLVNASRNYRYCFGTCRN